MEKITVEARVIINDVEAPYDGGRVVLQLTPAEDSELYKRGIVHVSVVVYALTDALLSEFPSTRKAMESTGYLITIEQAPAA